MQFLIFYDIQSIFLLLPMITIFFIQLFRLLPPDVGILRSKVTLNMAFIKKK